MFGYLSKTRFSATCFMLTSALILVTPKCFGLRPPRGLCFLIPPVPTRIRTTMIPCFALYPSLLALWILLGFSILVTASSLRHPTTLSLISGELSFQSLIQIWSCWLGIIATSKIPLIYCQTIQEIFVVKKE